MGGSANGTGKRITAVVDPSRTEGPVAASTGRIRLVVANIQREELRLEESLDNLEPPVAAPWSVDAAIARPP